jgi:hypothetical protein
MKTLLLEVSELLARNTSKGTIFGLIFRSGHFMVMRHLSPLRTSIAKYSPRHGKCG